MSDNSLYPKEIIEIEADHPFAKYSRSSLIIYLSAIAFIILILILLPFVNVEISVKSNGILRPAIEISKLKIPISGKVSVVLVTENDRVTKGQTLLILDSSLLSQKKNFLKEEVSEDKEFETDLELLITEKVVISKIKTPFYKQSYLDYQRKMREQTIHFSKVKANYQRQQRLHKEKVIADAEFENHQFEYDDARNNLEILKQTQLTHWQSDLLKYQKEIAEHEAQLRLLDKDAENLIIKAAVSGTLESFESLHEGSQVFANQEVGQISPDTSLVVEVYVNPSDIGLLKHNMTAQLQINAFNYNQWGLARGKVAEISSDVHIINDRPVFKVKCTLANNFLQLKNGYKGHFKKGMTLQARFLITERSLWQLLYDKVDDWLNPNLINKYEGS